MGSNRSLQGVGVVLLLAGAAATAWAVNYRQEHAFEGALGSLMGNPSSTFRLASTLIPIGEIAAVTGLVLLVVGLVRRS